MGLDSSAGCVNSRDVGEWLNLLAARQVMPRGRLPRGGKLDHADSASGIGTPRTVINLRRGPDRASCLFGAEGVHLPAADGAEVYETHRPVVRRWLNWVVEVAAAPGTRLPLLSHCTSGKDRTGFAVAALLSLLGIERELIAQEYRLSDGDVRRGWIEGALGGLGNVETYFAPIDRVALRRRFLSA